MRRGSDPAVLLLRLLRLQEPQYLGTAGAEPHNIPWIARDVQATLSPKYLKL